MPRDVSKRTTRALQIHYDCFRAECWRLASSSTSGDRAKEANATRDFWTESGRRATSPKTTRAVDRHGTPNTVPENSVELSERLERLDKSARAPASCLHAQDTNRQAGLIMIEAAKYMCKNVLEKANEVLERTMSQQTEDPERVTPQQPGDHAEATQGKRRCLRFGISRELSCPRSEASSKRPRPYTGTSGTARKVLRSRSATANDRNKLYRQLEESVPIYRTGEWKYEFKIFSLTTRISNLL